MLVRNPREYWSSGYFSEALLCFRENTIKLSELFDNISKGIDTHLKMLWYGTQFGNVWRERVEISLESRNNDTHDAPSRSRKILKRWVFGWENRRRHPREHHRRREPAAQSWSKVVPPAVGNSRSEVSKTAEDATHEFPRHPSCGVMVFLSDGNPNWRNAGQSKVLLIILNYFHSFTIFF